MTAVPFNIIVDNIVEMNEYLTDVAMGDGLSLLLVAVGSILIAFSLGVFGLLSLGAAASLVTSD
ncbi:hypothetical protein OB905_13730 [Halobacteria archaeon AArc-dxtr1]|nr:hypothetical protein [Halobacteria archaeon AArc-dxtr1]